MPLSLTDIKSFPTKSYHKYKYLLIFLNDFTSMAWAIPSLGNSVGLGNPHRFIVWVYAKYGCGLCGPTHHLTHICTGRFVGSLPNMVICEGYCFF